MLLASELIRGAGASKTAAFLHGILGSGANLRSHAKRFVQARPEWQVLLLDLRAHGESLGAEGADTVAAAARDVEQTARSLALSLSAVVGHSFGGKVALELARSHVELEHVVTLDSSPGARPDARGSETTAQVMMLLETLRGPWASREDFVREVEARGQPRGVAQWLAMNVARADGQFVFRLDLSRIRALLEDYLVVDLWPVLEEAARSHQGPRFHLVIGGRSRVYEPDDRARAEALEALAGESGFVTVDVLDAGHWVHVDDPDGVARVLQHRLARSLP